MKKDKHQYNLILSFFIFGTGLAFLSFLPIPPIIRIVYTWCGIVVLCRANFIASTLHTIYSGACLCAIALLTEAICYWLLHVLGWNSMLSLGVERSIFILLSKIVQLSLVLLAAAFIHKERFLLKLRSIIPLLLCQIFCIYLCDTMMVIFRHNSNDIPSYQFFIILIGTLYLNVIIILYSEVIKTRQQEQYDADLREQRLELQLNYYKNLQLEQEQTRSLYHDISKYLATMESMVSFDNKSSASQLLLDVKDSFKNVGQLVDVGNLELSAILNHYIHQAHEFDISVSISAWVPESLAVSPLDFSVVIGNTFENAIEACLGLPAPQRKISLQISLHNHILLYEISNSFSPGKKCRLNTKKTYHGYGLKNVEKIITKYHGSLDITNSENLFQICIYLNLPKNLVNNTSKSFQTGQLDQG